MVWLRTRPLSDDDVTIEVRQRIWWTFGIFSRWVEKSTARSAVNKVEWEVIELCAKIEKLLAKRMALADAAEAQWKDSKENSKVNFGKSTPFHLDDKTFKENVAEYTDRPDESWIKFFNPHIIKRYALGQRPSQFDQRSNNSRRAGQHAQGGPIVPGQSGVTAYTLDEFASKSYHFAEESGVDQVLGFKEQKPGDEGDRKARMKKLRQDYPKQSGESDNEWNNRIQRIMKEQDQSKE